MKKLFQIIKDIHSGKGEISAKRVYGGIGFLACVIAIVIFKRDLLSELLYTSATMIGLDTIRQIAKQNKSDQ